MDHVESQAGGYERPEGSAIGGERRRYLLRGTGALMSGECRATQPDVQSLSEQVVPSLGPCQAPGPQLANLVWRIVVIGL